MRLNVQLLVAAKSGILTLIDPLPAVAPVTAVPATHVVANPGVLTNSPEGKVSPNVMSGTEKAFGLFIVNVKEVVPFTGTTAAPKAFANVSGPCWAIELPMSTRAVHAANAIFLCGEFKVSSLK